MGVADGFPLVEVIVPLGDGLRDVDVPLPLPPPLPRPVVVGLPALQ